MAGTYQLTEMGGGGGCGVAITNYVMCTEIVEDADDADDDDDDDDDDDAILILVELLLYASQLVHSNATWPF